MNECHYFSKSLSVSSLVSCVITELQYHHWSTVWLQNFSVITGLLCDYITSVSSLVYCVITELQYHHWSTVWLQNFSVITGLLCDYRTSVSSLVYCVITELQYHHWSTEWLQNFHINFVKQKWYWGEKKLMIPISMNNIYTLFSSVKISVILLVSAINYYYCIFI